jgi:hypothetical protein
MPPKMGKARNLLLSILVLVPMFCFAGQAFEKGWECGRNEGWKQVKGDYSLPPLAPFPPFPPFGKDDFRGGYNLGFLAGMSEATQ